MEEAGSIEGTMDQSQTSIIHGRRLEDKGLVKRTVISFDMGGSWSYLKAPSTDMRNNPDCKPNQCWLHLHDLSEASEFAFYSYKNALGIVMGAGNVGAQLGNDVKASKTYVSRDAGLSWDVAATGNYIYEYGNLGGLLLMADMVNPTTVVQYSGDEGKTWDRISFTSEAMIVNNVLIESDAKSRKFIVYGTNLQGRDGILYHLDFSGVQTRQCNGRYTRH